MQVTRLVRCAVVLLAISAVLALAGCCLKETVATPTFDPLDGSDLSSYGYPDVLETISTDTLGATIYYTLDGSTPTTASTLYAGPFTFGIGSGDPLPPMVIKAIAVHTGMKDSKVGTASYTWDY
jgi:Chitobiase/beta-hexosaminidase C-terminal domain